MNTSKLLSIEKKLGSNDRRTNEQIINDYNEYFGSGLSDKRISLRINVPYSRLMKIIPAELNNF